MFDKTDPNHWREITPEGNTFITLTDEQTLKDLMDEDASDALKGLELTVVSSEVITQQEEDFKILLFELEGYKIPLYLLIKTAKGVEDSDFRIYFKPDDFDPGTREDLLARDCCYLFNEPDDPDDFVPSDLDHASHIPNEDPDTKEEIDFKTKYGVVFCEGKKHGERHADFIAVSEYLADKDCPNPECIILEYGGLNDEGEPLQEGGYMVFLQGAPIGTESFDVLTTIEV